MSLISNSRNWPKAEITTNFWFSPPRVYGDNTHYYDYQIRPNHPNFFGLNPGSNLYGQASIPMSDYWNDL